MFSKGRLLSLEDVLDKVTNCQILSYYFGITSLPCTIKSPLRLETSPSFRITINSKNQIYFYDFGTTESGSLFDLLSKKWGISFNSVLQRVHEDIPKIIGISKEVKINTTQEFDKNTKKYSKNTILKVKVREWKDWDIKYWNQYGISPSFLKFSRTYPISHIIVEKNKNQFVFGADKYAYVYVEFKDGNPTIKVYQPFNKEYKWKNNHDSSVWDLWEQLPKNGDKVIITSSRKDAMCIWNNTHIPSCSLQAESYIPKEQVINELKERFKEVFVLYDNDFDKEENYGRKYGNTLSTEFNLKQIEIPTNLQSKDASDLYYNHGKEILIKTILDLC